MSDYAKSTNFTTKDTLPTGNSGKIVKGTELDIEFTNIASAVTSKANSDSPTFTGTPSVPTATTGTNTTQVASTAFVKNSIDALGTIGTMAAQAASSVAITGGTITGITDLAVADGGTGSSTLAANAVLLGNGTSALQTVAPGTSGNVLTSNGTTWSSTALATKGLGLGGETWNNVTGSRSFNTLYTNSRSYPIAVSASTSCSTGSNITAYVDGMQIAFFSWQFNGCGSFGGTFIIVPPGKTYQLNSGQSVTNWVELY